MPKGDRSAISTRELEMKRRLAVLFVAASVAGAAPAVAPQLGGPLLSAPAASAKTCSSGYTHAVMPDGAHKCLRAGQFCSRRSAWQRTYKRKGFYCPPSGHLRRR
jgi:hypothetical protein